jgi:hypothetical protein
VPELPSSLDALAWRGADRTALTALLAELGEEAFIDRVPRFR